MNHWESIVNIALCRYKLVSSHKYRHMYKSRNKKSSYRLSLLHPFRRLSSLLPCHLHDRTQEIIIITDSSLTLKQSKLKSKGNYFFLGFLRFNERKKKGEIFLGFC